MVAVFSVEWKKRIRGSTKSARLAWSGTMCTCSFQRDDGDGGGIDENAVTGVGGGGIEDDIVSGCNYSLFCFALGEIAVTQLNSVV